MQTLNIVASVFLFSALFFGLCACAHESALKHNPKAHLDNSKISAAPIVPSPTKPLRQVQDFFHMEESVIHPIEVPVEALLTLQSGEFRIVDACMLNGAIRKECYEAGKADLNGDDLPDFVVIGRGKMLGANITPFWIFLGTKNGPRLVLETAAHDLSIGAQKRKGLFNVATASMTAVEIVSKQFSFNGRNYELIKTIREPI